MGAVRTGIGGDQDFHLPNIGALRDIERANDLLELLDAAVGADEDGEGLHYDAEVFLIATRLNGSKDPKENCYMIAARTIVAIELFNK